MKPRLRLLAAAAALCLGPVAWAGAPSNTDPCAGRSQASCNALGVVEKPSLQPARGGLGAAERQQLTGRATKMLEVVLQAPQFHPPKGMSLHPTITVEGPPAHAAKHHPAMVRTTLLAKLIDVENKRAAQDKKTGAWKGTGEGPILRLHVNDLGVFLSNDTLDLSKPAQFFSAPKKTGEVQGFPVYDVGGKEVLLLSKGDALPWKAFSVESYIQMLLSQEQETQALIRDQLASATGAEKKQLEKTNAEQQATLDALKQQLAQLSPAQRQAGACQSSSNTRDNPSGLDFTCGASSNPLMVANQDIFPRTAAKGSQRFLTLTTTWGVLPKDDRMPNALGRVMRASLQDMDLKALQAMLD
ncbi:hypothetical protein ATI61_105476 [Archangium gephyra]|uniref:Uncharacterized protein n=1 Tax=Archangium gephyra TaxID=48 RepID=A0AAC8THW3_9BACT|nr:hypothetical protein [Archangium gephyra]AKJ06538.1 Hypothetical protein AA314_08164 [Archangium gephyra]REG32148.1 hypothetical protein ATI61_105476 [Archangium gephyra]